MSLLSMLGMRSTVSRAMSVASSPSMATAITNISASNTNNTTAPPRGTYSPNPSAPPAPNVSKPTINYYDTTAQNSNRTVFTPVSEQITSFITTPKSPETVDKIVEVARGQSVGGYMDNLIYQQQLEGLYTNYLASNNSNEGFMDKTLKTQGAEDTPYYNILNEFEFKMPEIKIPNPLKDLEDKLTNAGKLLLLFGGLYLVRDKI